MVPERRHETAKHIRGKEVMISSHETNQERAHNPHHAHRGSYHGLYHGLWPTLGQGDVGGGEQVSGSSSSVWERIAGEEDKPKEVGGSRQESVGDKARMWRTSDPSIVLSFWKGEDGTSTLRRWDWKGDDKSLLYRGNAESNQWMASWSAPYYGEATNELVIRELGTGCQVMRWVVPKSFQLNQLVAVSRPEQVGVYLENQTYAYFAVWNLCTGKEDVHIPIFRVHHKNRTQTLQSLQVACGGNMLVVHQGRVLSCWDLRSGQSMSHVIHHADLVRVVCAEKAPMLATLSRKSVSIWSGLDRSHLIHCMNLAGEYSAVAFAWNGEFVATGDQQGRIKVWHMATLSCVQEWRTSSGIETLLFSQEDRTVLSGHTDGTMRSQGLV